jgi:hypothetical protein
MSGNSLILAVKLKITGKDSEVYLNDLKQQSEIFDFPDVNVTCNFLFRCIDNDKLTNEITRIQKFLKKKQAKLIGEICVVLITTENENKTGKLKIYANEQMKFIDCDFKISGINYKNKNGNGEEEKDLEKESYDEEDKVELFRKFIYTHKREPMENETFDGFKIGKYYNKLKIVSVNYNNLVAIIREAIPENIQL